MILGQLSNKRILKKRMFSEYMHSIQSILAKRVKDWTCKDLDKLFMLIFDSKSPKVERFVSNIEKSRVILDKMDGGDDLLFRKVEKMDGDDLVHQQCQI